LGISVVACITDIIAQNLSKCQIRRVTSRIAMRKRGLSCRPVSVCLTRWCIVSTPLKISSNFFLCLLATFS